MIFLISLAVTIFTMVHMWKRVDTSTLVKLLIALAFSLIPFSCIAWWIYYFIKKPEVIAPANNENADTPSGEGEMNNMENPNNNAQPGKKEFFFKRWMRRLVEWVDLTYFSSEEEWLSPFKSLCQVFITCFITGILWWGNMIITDNSQNSFGVTLEMIAGAIMLVIFVLYIVKDVKRFNSPGIKVARGFYIFFLFGASAALALFLAMILVILFLLYLFFQVLWMMIFGDGTKYKLTNGDIVEKDNGIFGGGNDQYKSTSLLSNKTYIKDGDKFYHVD